MRHDVRFSFKSARPTPKLINVLLENIYIFLPLPQVKHKYHWRACCLATFLPELQEGVNVVLRTSALLACLSYSLFSDACV